MLILKINSDKGPDWCYPSDTQVQPELDTSQLEFGMAHLDQPVEEEKTHYVKDAYDIDIFNTANVDEGGESSLCERHLREFLADQVMRQIECLVFWE